MNEERKTSRDTRHATRDTAPVLIVGATSGVARSISEELARRGHDLVLAARDGEEARAIADDLRIRFNVATETEPFDALAYDSHRQLLERYGELQGVVLCHGYLARPDVAEGDFDEARRMIEINFTSYVSVLTVASAYFYKRRRGFICVLSSVAGDRGRPSNYAYGATKAALSAYVSGLRARLGRCGVRVITIKPGPVDTAMTWGRPVAGSLASSSQVARDVCRAIEKGRNVIYTPWIWRPIMAVIRAIPEPIFKRMKL